MLQNTRNTRNRAAVAPRAADMLECLTFKLGSEEYGIDLDAVQELRPYDAVLPIAQMPDFIKGVINLRGLIIPVIDLRIKFHCKPISYDEHTVVIVLHVDTHLLGLVVNAVTDVIALGALQIKAPTHRARPMLADYLCGIGQIKHRKVSLIDIAHLMSLPELRRMQRHAA
jgi:purine-binding chemotaxis protein CheW